MTAFYLGFFLVLTLFIALMYIVYITKSTQSHLQLTQTLLKDLNDQQALIPNKIDLLQTQFNELQIKLLRQLHQDTARAMTELNQQLNQNIKLSSTLLEKDLNQLREQTSHALQNINKTVEKNLDKNFEKTAVTFTEIVQRLTLIDEAQKKISHLSEQVVDLQHLLSDKQARGAWGEMQLDNILKNMFPKDHYAVQHTLSNGKRVDFMLFLPEPTGNVPVDAKFPLENYRKLHNDPNASLESKRKAEQLFKQDIKKHIDAIASKYILPPETSNGVIMFLPAEAIFAELHANYPEVVEYAQQKQVWIVSPTTLMAILTTAKAVLKDEATRKQVHLMKEHLIGLAKDFSRFEKRMQNLTRHIGQMNEDVVDVNKSAKKITAKFNKIEKAEFETITADKEEAVKIT